MRTGLGTDYIYFDMHDSRSDFNNVDHLTIYGEAGSHSGVPTSVFDQEYIIDNGKMKMQMDLNIDTHSTHSDQKLLFEMTDTNTELGLGTDLDLSGHKIEQGANNVMHANQKGKAVFPKGLDLDGNEIVDGSNVLVAYRNNKLKLFQELDLNEDNIIGISFMINGIYKGSTHFGEYHRLNIGTLTNEILIPFNSKLRLRPSLYLEFNSDEFNSN